MSDEYKKQIEKSQNEFIRRVSAKEERKIKAGNAPAQSIWFGLGMVGVIGWSVTVPILVGVAAGLWLDKNYPVAHSWTLSMLALGAFIGCINAWHWVDRENERIKKEHREKEDKDE